jgi:hypothetical protein
MSVNMSSIIFYLFSLAYRHNKALSWADHFEDKLLGVSFPIVAWIGIDWAAQANAVPLQAVGSDQVESFEVAQGAEALESWVDQLRARFPSRLLGGDCIYPLLPRTPFSRGPLGHMGRLWSPVLVRVGKINRPTLAAPLSD